MRTWFAWVSILNLMKVIVSDMGGVLYSFDPGFDPDKHQEEFDRAMQKLGKEGAPIKEQLAGEWEAVRGELLKIYAVKRGVENMLVNLKSYKLVIVSTSLIKTSQLILEKIGLEKKAWKTFDMSDFGSKKDPTAWKKTFEHLHTIDVIVEDNERNLAAAQLAAKELGFTPKAFKEVPVLSI